MQLCFFLSLGNSAYRGYKQRFHFPKHFTRGDILHSMYQLVNHCICYRHYEYWIDRRVVCSTHAFLYRCKLFCWLQILGRVSSIWSSTSVALFSFLSRIFKGHTNSQAFVATEFQEVLVFSFLRVLWTLQFSALFRRRQTRLCRWGSLSKLFPSVVLQPAVGVKQVTFPAPGSWLEVPAVIWHFLLIMAYQPSRKRMKKLSRIWMAFCSVINFAWSE